MPRMMKVLDFERFGNVVSLFFGAIDLESWWGDDWDDVPYEHNAGTVYFDKYASLVMDVAFPSAFVVSEPCDGHMNSSWSKSDMQAGRVPMLAILRVPDDQPRWLYEDSFEKVSADRGAKRLFMGSVVDVDDVESWLGCGAHVIAREEVPSLP